jgi:hypothetical protein
MVECIDEWLNDKVSNFEGDLVVLLCLLQYEFHKLTSWCVDGQCFCLLIFSWLALACLWKILLGILSPDKLQGNLNQNIKIVDVISKVLLNHRNMLIKFALYLAWWNLLSLLHTHFFIQIKILLILWISLSLPCVAFILVTLIIEKDNMRLAHFDDHVFNDVVLRIEDNISQLSKILDDILSFKFTIDYNIIILINSKVRILNEFFNQRV